MFAKWTIDSMQHQFNKNWLDRQNMGFLRNTNVSTTPLRQWGFRQCLPFSWTTLRGKDCRHPIAITVVVDMFGHCLFSFQNWITKKSVAKGRPW